VGGVKVVAIHKGPATALEKEPPSFPRTRFVVVPRQRIVDLETSLVEEQADERLEVGGRGLRAADSFPLGEKVEGYSKKAGDGNYSHRGSDETRDGGRHGQGRGRVPWNASSRRAAAVYAAFDSFEIALGESCVFAVALPVPRAFKYLL
jgi:hypothetical protein